MPQTLTLTDFLLARIAEDEAVAEDALAPIVGHELTSEWHWTCTYKTPDHQWRSTAAAPDPARVLAECEAKRRIVELHDGAHECSTYDHTGEVDNYTWCVDASDCSTMQLLAAVHADHPDYREDWKP